MDTTQSFTASLEATNEHDLEYQDCNADSLPCETWSLSASASSSTHSDEKMHHQLRSDMMMFQPRPRSPHPVDILSGGISSQQSQSAPIIRGSPTISSMQEKKSLTAATWHPIPNNRTKSDHLHNYLYSKNVLTTNDLHQYIDYLHSSKVEAESKLARLQTDFDLLSMEYKRLKRCFVLTSS
jgi:hypothetical protein